MRQGKYGGLCKAAMEVVEDEAADLIRNWFRFENRISPVRFGWIS
jgi:hypothetical protein